MTENAILWLSCFFFSTKVILYLYPFTAPLDLLGRMFPTPPSHETNKSHSPETMTDVTTEGILTSGAAAATGFHSTVESQAPPLVEPISSVKVSVKLLFFLMLALCWLLNSIC